MTNPAHYKYLLLAVLFIFGTINFTRTSMEIMRNSKRLDTLNNEVVGLEKQKSGLEESISYKKTDEYIEEKARNELNLIKPGEKVYIISKEITDNSIKSTILGEKDEKTLKDDLFEKDATNLDRWVALVFK